MLTLTHDGQVGNCVWKLVCWLPSAVIEGTWSNGQSVTMGSEIIVGSKNQCRV
jgi:hypothetical protein